MNIRLKRIIKIGLSLIVFFINILNCSEDDIVLDREKKIQAAMMFAFNKGEKLGNGLENITDQTIKKIDNLDSYLKFDKSNNTYKVKGDKEEELLGVLLSLMDEQPNRKYYDCTPECNNEEHLIVLPTCKEKGCKYAFYNHLVLRLFEKKNEIPCLLAKEPTVSQVGGHFCSFSLGSVWVDRDSAFSRGGIQKIIFINPELGPFLKDFGGNVVDGKNTSLKEIIENTISGGGNTKNFNTGIAKCCRNCKTVLFKDNCLDNSNKISCSGCKDKFICFKCLYDFDDGNINHDKCIDSQDCDLYAKYGGGVIFVGKINEKKNNPKDTGIENFEENRYYHPRRCYNCKGWSGKDRHCNLITCICGARWCWFCGKKYDSKHWKVGTCKNLHLKGDYEKKFDPALNEKMIFNDDDLLPWERKKDKVSKKEIENFLGRGKLETDGEKKKKNLSQCIVEICCDCCWCFE